MAYPLTTNACQVAGDRFEFLKRRYGSLGAFSNISLPEINASDLDGTMSMVATIAGENIKPMMSICDTLSVYEQRHHETENTLLGLQIRLQANISQYESLTRANLNAALSSEARSKNSNARGINDGISFPPRERAEAGELVYEVPEGAPLCVRDFILMTTEEITNLLQFYRLRLLKVAEPALDDFGKLHSEVTVLSNFAPIVEENRYLSLLTLANHINLKLRKIRSDTLASMRNRYEG